MFNTTTHTTKFFYLSNPLFQYSHTHNSKQSNNQTSNQTPDGTDGTSNVTNYSKFLKFLEEYLSPLSIFVLNLRLDRKWIACWICLEIHLCSHELILLRICSPARWATYLTSYSACRSNFENSCQILTELHFRLFLNIVEIHFRPL